MILMCRPTFFDVTYDINPWMSNNIGNSNSTLAKQQWEALYNTISTLTDTTLIDPQPSLPDMVFTANAGAIIDGKFVLSNFKHVERQGEEEHFERWFYDHGYTTVHVDTVFEGAGDLLKNEIGIYFGGYGKRSDRKSIDQLHEKFPYEAFVPLKLVTDKFYHLDTCFCPLDGSSVLCYLPAFDQSSQDKIKRMFDHVIEVSDSDAQIFACNAVKIGNNIIVPMISELLKATLEVNGYNVYRHDMSEFMKAGGACKCLTLLIDH